MSESKCPVCGCQNFYVKNPDDEFETFEFQLKDKQVCFEPDVEASDAPEVVDSTETFCDKCAWHGKITELKE
jgi:hypothetical protein